MLVAISGCAALVRPNFSQTLTDLRSGEYTLDPEHAYVHFHIEHLGLSTVVGRFNEVDAELDFNPQAMEDLRLEGVIQAGSIDMNNADLEKRLRGSSWLSTERYPEASFKTQSVTPRDNQTAYTNGHF